MLSHGAHLVLTAEDAFNPSADPLYPTNIWPLPGPGMFGALFRKVRALPDESDESVASIWATHVRMALMGLMGLVGSSPPVPIETARGVNSNRCEATN